MNKQEYMSKLVEALSVFDEEIRNEIVTDYEEHFENGAKSGKSEEQIAEELGSIEELVSDLNALSGNAGNTEDSGSEENKEEEASKKKFAEEASEKINEAVKNFAALIGEMAAGVAKGTGKVTSTVGEGAKEFAGSAKDFGTNFASGFMKGYENLANGVGNVADKVAEKSSKFAKEVSNSYRKSMNLPPKEENKPEDAEFEGLDDFELDDDSAENDAEFENFEDGQFVSFSDDVENIVIEVEGAEVYLDKSEGEAVTINYENEGNPNQQLLYRLNYEQKGKTLHISVKRQPGISNFFKTLGCPDISLYVGIGEGIRKVSVRTMSGEVNVSQIDVEQLTITSMSGDITVDDSEISTADLSTMSGDIDVNAEDAASISLGSVSGDVNFDGSAESLHVKSTSGDIDLRSIRPGADVTASTVSGDIDVELVMDDGYVANVKSTTGSIDLLLNGEEKEVARNGVYIMGEGGAKLTLSSISGDITVQA